MLDIIRDLHLTVQNIVAGIAFISQVTDDIGSLKWKIKNGLNQPTIIISYNMKFEQTVEDVVSLDDFCNVTKLNVDGAPSYLTSINTPKLGTTEEFIRVPGEMFIKNQNEIEDNKHRDPKEVTHPIIPIIDEEQIVEDNHQCSSVSSDESNFKEASATKKYPSDANQISKCDSLSVVKENSSVPKTSCSKGISNQVLKLQQKYHKHKIDSNILKQTITSNAEHCNQFKKISNYDELSGEKEIKENSTSSSKELVKIRTCEQNHDIEEKIMPTEGLSDANEKRMKDLIIHDFNILDHKHIRNTTDEVPEVFSVTDSVLSTETCFETVKIPNHFQNIVRQHLEREQTKQNIIVSSLENVLHNVGNEHRFNSRTVTQFSYSSREKICRRNGREITENKLYNSEKRYPCRFCGKRFARCDAKNSHERIHTGDKPFSCRYCGKRFTQGNTMKRHERIHTGEKPFLCKYCGKRFSQGATLKTHERVHTGAKPYSCKICGKNFRHLSTLRYHKLLHEEENL